jgi:hypothetical protein
MTFKEAYERTGRILNVSCVPADPHSPTILCNYLTSPDCVIWSAVLASAAVPGILNPVVLMMKTPDGALVPYSFGHKVRDTYLSTVAYIHSALAGLTWSAVERWELEDRYSHQGPQPPFQCQFYYCQPSEPSHLVILLLIKGYGRVPSHAPKGSWLARWVSRFCYRAIHQVGP